VTSPVLLFRLGLRDFITARLSPVRGGAVPFLFTALAMVRIDPTLLFNVEAKPSQALAPSAGIYSPI
jgi:hypothetical protein